MSASALAVPCRPAGVHISNIWSKLVKKIELTIEQKIYD